MTVTDRIEINPKVMLGKPVIRGTGITVESILRKLSDGATEADLVRGRLSLRVRAPVGISGWFETFWVLDSSKKVKAGALVNYKRVPKQTSARFAIPT
ncbi:MAG: DUF433 domain-containing protein [candidate division NC10 bacterium]|nr:DUF433 domain-containing protein [candidate division NC10 bacterium]